jgi:hypothetical protein
MQRTNDNVVFLNERSWWEWTKLIRKLHWIGLEDEARRLELAVSTLPPEERDCVSPDLPAPTRAKQ